MKTIISDKNKVNETAAQHIKALLEKKPDAVIAFSAGDSMTGLFTLLCDMHAKNEIDFSLARILAVTEFISAPEEKTCRYKLTHELLDKLNIPQEHRFFPSGDAPENYDALIASLGGLDLAVIGLGHNGHIGYNEPGTQFYTKTRVQRLAPATRRQLAHSFSGEENVPECAVTMGIKTLTDARDLIVMAFGSDKSGAVFQMLYARDDSVIPAAFLQIPLNVLVLVDEDAASML